MALNVSVELANLFEVKMAVTHCLRDKGTTTDQTMVDCV